MTDKDWLNDLSGDPDLDNKLSELDELIRSTKAELRSSDERMGEASAQAEPPAQTQEQSEPPKPAAFELHIPEIYADLTLEEDDEELPVRKPRKRMPAGLRVLIYVVSVLVASVLLALVGWKCADDVLALSKPDREVTITVDADDSIADISADLKQNGLIEYEWLFKFYCWFSHAEEKVDVGTYELNNIYDYHALINGMAGVSNRAIITVTIPEGYEVDQIFELLEDPKKYREHAADYTDKELAQMLKESTICSVEALRRAAENVDLSRYGATSALANDEQNRLEGYLFPDTYDFFVGDDPERVLEKFLKNFQRKFDEDMRADIDALNVWLRTKMENEGFSDAEIEAAKMDLHKVVTVASLIEKEAASAAESPTISSVIYNRLCSDQYPCLQIDATIQYVLTERKENLAASDLAIDSPYNTYTNPGIPIGPISNPGLASLQAALHPEDTEYYFYALDTDGAHHFTKTYFEHNQFLEQQKNDHAS